MALPRTLRCALKLAVDVAINKTGSDFDLAGASFTFVKVLACTQPHETHKHLTACVALEPRISGSGIVWLLPDSSDIQFSTVFSDPATGRTYVEESK